MHICYYCAFLNLSFHYFIMCFVFVSILIFFVLNCLIKISFSGSSSSHLPTNTCVTEFEVNSLWASCYHGIVLPTPPFSCMCVSVHVQVHMFAQMYKTCAMAVEATAQPCVLLFKYYPPYFLRKPGTCWVSLGQLMSPKDSQLYFTSVEITSSSKASFFIWVPEI